MDYFKSLVGGNPSQVPVAAEDSGKCNLRRPVLDPPC